MRTRLFLMAVFACSVLALAQISKDSESPRRLVHLSVAATDAKGEPVTDLRASEIQLREDGKPRPLAFFRFDGARREMLRPVPGEFANRPGVTPTVILFDRWNERLLTTAQAWGDVDNAIGRMESVDRIYIYFLTNQGELYPVHPLPPPDADPFAIRAPSPAELRVKLDDAVRKLSGFRNVDAYDPVRRANTTVQALTTIGMQMGPIAGRKNLIWVTHGFPILVQFQEQPIDFAPGIRKLSTAAVQSNLAIYTVDQSAAGAGADMIGESRQTLQMFAALTGGRWFPSGNAEQALAGALADGRGAYRVAYYAPYREGDRKEHKIRLESSRKGIHLQTREGYFGDTPEPDPVAVADALLNAAPHVPFDAAQIGLRAALTRDTAGARFIIRVDPADLLLNHAGGRYQGKISVAFAFYSSGGFQKALPSTPVELNLTEDQFQKAATDGVEIRQNIPLDSTLEKVRVIVLDDGLYGLGSVTLPLR